MSLHRIKLITFDVTNTLLMFRTRPGFQYTKIASKYGLKCSESQITEDFLTTYKRMCELYPNFGKDSGLSWEDWWIKVVKDTFKYQVTPDKRLDSIAADLIENYKLRDSWELVDGSIELLDHLRNNIRYMGIISNFDPRLKVILEAVDLTKYFDFVLTSYEAGFAKPAPEIFSFALSKVDSIQPSEALHIGNDIKYDYFGAINAGWHSVLVNKKFSKDNLIKQENIEVKHHYKDLLQLKNAMKCGMFTFSQ